MLFPSNGIENGKLSIRRSFNNSASLEIESNDAPKELINLDCILEQEEASQTLIFSEMCQFFCKKLLESQCGTVLVTGDDDYEYRDQFFSGAKDNPGMVCRAIKNLLRGCCEFDKLLSYSSAQNKIFLKQENFRDVFRSRDAIDQLSGNLKFLYVCGFKILKNDETKEIDFVDFISGNTKDLKSSNLMMIAAHDFQITLSQIKSFCKSAKQDSSNLFIIFKILTLDKILLNDAFDCFNSRGLSTYYLEKPQFAKLTIANIDKELYKKIRKIKHARKFSHSNLDAPKSIQKNALNSPNLLTELDFDNFNVLCAVKPQTEISSTQNASLSSLIKLLSIVSGKKLSIFKSLLQTKTFNDNLYETDHQNTPVAQPAKSKKDNLQSDELIAAEFDGNQNYRPDFNPTKLNGHDLHFNVNKHSTVYPTLQEMRQAHPFDENLLNSLSAQIYDKHSASKSLFGHFVKCRSEISTNLNQNYEQQSQLHAQNVNLQNELSSVNELRKSLEHQLSKTCAESIELRNEYGRLDGVYKKRVSDQLDNLKQNLSSEFGEKRQVYKKALSQKDQKLALLREIAKSDSPSDVLKRLGSGSSVIPSANKENFH